MNFRNCDGGLVADRIIQVIIENKQRLTDYTGKDKTSIMGKSWWQM